jgi:hypothetical protein
MKAAMGGNTDSCNGTRHSAIEHFFAKCVKDGQPEKVMQLFCQM